MVRVFSPLPTVIQVNAIHDWLWYDEVSFEERERVQMRTCCLHLQNTHVILFQIVNSNAIVSHLLNLYPIWFRCGVCVLYAPHLPSLHDITQIIEYDTGYLFPVFMIHTSTTSPICIVYNDSVGHDCDRCVLRISQPQISIPLWVNNPKSPKFNSQIPIVQNPQENKGRRDVKWGSFFFSSSPSSESHPRTVRARSESVCAYE